MRVIINGFEINSELNRVYVDSITGLDIPPIRSSKGIRSGQSGGYYGAQFFGPRPITIIGHLFADSMPEARQKSKQLQDILAALYPDQLELQIVDEDGATYLIYCQLEDFDLPLEKQLFKYKYKIELEAPDPAILDDTAGQELTAVITKLIPGGLYWSSTTPQFGSSNTFYFTAGQPNASVNNPSSITVSPVVTINGKTTNPLITNVTTGETFRMLDYAVPTGSVTVIDMQAHTITLNGGNVYAYWDETSQWISLVPGINEFIFDSAAPSDVAQATLKWRPARWGI